MWLLTYLVCSWNTRKLELPLCPSSLGIVLQLLSTCNSQTTPRIGLQSKPLSLVMFIGLSFLQHSWEDGFLNCWLFSLALFSQLYSSFLFCSCKGLRTWISWKFGFPSLQALHQCKLSFLETKLLRLFLVRPCDCYLFIIENWPVPQNVQESCIILRPIFGK